MFFGNQDMNMIERESHVNDKTNVNLLNESMRSSYRGADSHERVQEGLGVPR